MTIWNIWNQIAKATLPFKWCVEGQNKEVWCVIINFFSIIIKVSFKAFQSNLKCEINEPSKLLGW